VCLLVGSAVGALCNPPLPRHPAAAMLSTLAAIILALAAGVSPMWSPFLAALSGMSPIGCDACAYDHPPCLREGKTNG
jgi:hypothetical protein